MALRECPAGTALQVLLKPRSRMLSGEFQRHNNRPRSVGNRVSRRPVIVPFESLTHVVCQANVVTRWIDVTSQDVDNAFLNSMHANNNTHERYPYEIGLNRRIRQQKYADPACV